MTRVTLDTSAASDPRLRIYLFTYNRARFINNCVDSIAQLAPAHALTIIDDNSDEPATRRLLDRLSERYNVIRPTTPTGEQTHKTGGLYANKNVALADAERAGAKYALYMHDDQQLVRPLRSADLSRFDDFFETNQRSFELHVCFMKLLLHEWDEQFARLDASHNAYIRSATGAKGHKYFSGSGVFHIERTRASLGEFALGEQINETDARELDAKLGFYAWPFMMWLPFPISYRGKQRKLAHRLMEWLGHGGFHPIDYLSAQDEKAFLERHLNIQPVAERFLKSATAPKTQYWSTMGGFYNASAHDGLRRSIARLIWKRSR